VEIEIGARVTQRAEIGGMMVPGTEGIAAEKADGKKTTGIMEKAVASLIGDVMMTEKTKALLDVAGLVRNQRSLIGNGGHE